MAAARSTLRYDAPVELGFDNTYARLPERFYARVKPTPVRAPRLLALNQGLAAELGLEPWLLTGSEGAEVLGGNAVPTDATPIALAYAGHQFGNFVPQLGDGRALLLGEIVDVHGRRRDVQLKGSGPTPFSRRGDGRAALGPVLREYIVSEAMHALGIPTTRALAAVATGEPVVRDDLLPGGVFTRVAASHLRVGTFQYFAARDDREAVALLARYALERHHPTVAASVGESPAAIAVALLEAVLTAQVSLVARWLGVGFIHGVMNTDNTSISGETIDYGPCAFLDEFIPDKAFSSIDMGKRYAFANQPRIALWNLSRLAETMLPLLGDDEKVAIDRATSILDGFADRFDAAYLSVFRPKLGLATADAGDRALLADLHERMSASDVDNTLFWRTLSDAADDEANDAAVAKLFSNQGAFFEWLPRWRARLAAEDAPPDGRASRMRAANPAIIPRNHRVEQALEAAVRHDDLAPFERLVTLLARPFDDQPDDAFLRLPPRNHERVAATFCGT